MDSRKEYTQAQCPFCRRTLNDFEESVAVCSNCGTIYHQACADYVGNKCVVCDSHLIGKKMRTLSPTRLFNLTIVAENFGKSIPIEEIDSDVTAQELLKALAEKINLPSNTPGVLTRKITRKKIKPNQTLVSAGVEDGETLTADYQASADAQAAATYANQSEYAKKFFEAQLLSLGLSKQQIEVQTREELKQSLERVNDAIKYPRGFGTLKLKMVSEGYLVATSSTDFHYEIGILPTLLEAKKTISDCLRSFQNDSIMKQKADTQFDGGSKIKILFLAANPLDTAQLRLDEEIRAIDQSLHQSKFRDKFDIRQHWAVRVIDLQSCLLRTQPDIVHFSGHGSKASEIILEDTLGNSHSVSSRALGQLFSVLKDNVRCVVLNACYSETQAQAIAKHIDCVVGMSTAIGDTAAISFSSAFYQALGYGRDVKTAFALGCIQIDLQNLDEQDTPKLLTSEGGSEKIIFVENN